MNTLNAISRIFPLLSLCALVLSANSTAAALTEGELLQRLSSPGHFAMLRHALAPGFGDPEDMSLDNCATQRNLNSAGRQQAVRIGELLRLHAVQEVSVYTSEWCRCKETADLLGYKNVSALPILNSFFQRRENSTQQTAELARWLTEKNLTQPVILVTHQVNITALTGRHASSGELLVLALADDGKPLVLGSIQTEASE